MTDKTDSTSYDHCRRKHRGITLGFLSMVFLSLPAHTAPNAFEYKRYESFREQILGHMSQAKKRIWMTTQFFSDGEIAASLHLARYRGLDVRVLLGAAKAQQYMSRLRFLKRQQIPVYLLPNQFYFRDESLILIDHKLLRLSAALDFMQQKSSYKIIIGSEQDAKRFEIAFLDALALKQPARERPLPPVKQPRRQPGYRNKIPNHLNAPATSQKQAGFNYDPYSATMRRRPPDMPKHLPKKTILEKKRSMQINKPEREHIQRPQQESREINQ